MENFLTKVAWVMAVIGSIATIINFIRFIWLRGIDEEEQVRAFYGLARKQVKSYTVPWAIVTVVAFIWIYR